MLPPCGSTRKKHLLKQESSPGSEQPTKIIGLKAYSANILYNSKNSCDQNKGLLYRSGSLAMKTKEQIVTLNVCSQSALL